MSAGDESHLHNKCADKSDNHQPAGGQLRYNCHRVPPAFEISIDGMVVA